MINTSANLFNQWSSSDYEDHKNPLTVNSCGYQKFITKDLQIERDKGRVDYQIICIVNGKGIFRFENETLEVSKGNIVVYIPGQPQYYEYHASDSAELYWVHFTGYEARKYLAGFGLLDKPAHYTGVCNEYAELYKKILNEFQLKSTMYECFASAHLLELLSLFARKLKSSENNSVTVMDDTIKRTIESMHVNYNRNRPISEYAGKCNLSLYRFIHKFKESTGMTPVEYIRKIRMDEARYLLSNSSLNISEISSIVGYEDPLYFSRVFKKVTGISPSCYKDSGPNKLL